MCFTFEKSFTKKKEFPLSIEDDPTQNGQILGRPFQLPRLPVYMMTRMPMVTRHNILVLRQQLLAQQRELLEFELLAVPRNEPAITDSPPPENELPINDSPTPFD